MNTYFCWDKWLMDGWMDEFWYSFSWALVDHWMLAQVPLEVCAPWFGNRWWRLVFGVSCSVLEGRSLISNTFYC